MRQSQSMTISGADVFAGSICDAHVFSFLLDVPVTVSDTASVIMYVEEDKVKEKESRCIVKPNQVSGECPRQIQSRTKYIYLSIKANFFGRRLIPTMTSFRAP